MSVMLDTIVLISALLFPSKKMKILTSRSLGIKILLMSLSTGREFVFRRLLSLHTVLNLWK